MPLPARPGAPGRAAGQPDTAPPPPAAHAPAQACADAPEPKRAPVLLIDGTGLLVRCSRAGRDHALTAPDGTPTAALLMFISSLAKRLRLERPSHAVIAWDGPDARAWRRELYPGYKAGRPDAPASAALLSAQAAEFCSAAGLHQVTAPGFEADDVLAALSRSSADMDDDPPPVVICSDDGDMLQLLDERTTRLSLTSDLRVTAADVEADWGLAPIWLPKLRALCGDSSDNIPGLPGVGPKKALRMMLDGRLIWPLPPSVIPDPEHRKMVVVWRDVMDLVVPIRPPEVTLGHNLFRLADEARWEPSDACNVRELLDRYGMVRLVQRLEKGGLW